MPYRMARQSGRLDFKRLDSRNSVVRVWFHRTSKRFILRWSDGFLSMLYRVLRRLWDTTFTCQDITNKSAENFGYTSRSHRACFSQCKIPLGKFPRAFDRFRYIYFSDELFRMFSRSAISTALSIHRSITNARFRSHYFQPIDWL
jgi:hypothetical protein